MTRPRPEPGPSGPATPWTIAELELFHDGELPGERADRLARDLRTDAALRSRLASIADADRRVASVIAMPTTGRDASPRRAMARVLLAAASFAMLAAAWIALKPSPAPSSTVITHPPKHAIHAEDATRHHPAAAIDVPSTPSIVIASVRIPPGPTTEIVPDTAPAVDAGRASTALAAHLARGDADAAARLLSSLDEPRRREAIAAIALSIRSALTAEAVLDAMPPEKQIEISVAWAAEPRLRPVAFRRLAQLRQIEELSARIGEIAHSLHDDPELRPWVRSYIALPKS